MDTNRQIDLTRIMATAQVILNVCAAPAIGRKQLMAVHYAAALLEHAAHASLEQFDLLNGGNSEGATAHREGLISAFAPLAHQPLAEVRHG